MSGSMDVVVVETDDWRVLTISGLKYALVTNDGWIGVAYTREVADRIAAALNQLPGDAERERDALREWRNSVSAVIKNIPEFHSGHWGGDKEGWGFHFEVVRWLLRDREKLQKFKTYVHARLDEAGVPVDPESHHKEHGCRIGGRLDEVLSVYVRSRQQSTSPPAEPATWAVVELMGHLRLAGRLTEEERFGTKLGRLDIPQEDGSFVTRFIGGQSVYSITIVSEEAARLVAKRSNPAPVSQWELPKQLPAPAPVYPEFSQSDEDGLDDHHTGGEG